jgi:hypothetical protein
VNQSRLSSSDATATVLPSDVVASGRCGGCLPVDVELMDVQAVGGYLAGHNLKHTQAVYGFFAIVLGLMSWLYLSAQVTPYAAEVNVVRARRLWPRSILQPPLPQADQQALIDLARQEERRPEQAINVKFTPGQRIRPRWSPALAPRPARHLADAKGAQRGWVVERRDLGERRVAQRFPVVC